MSRRRAKRRNGTSSIIQRLGNFNIIFTLAWIAAVGAYFLGFWEVFSDSNVPINGVAWLILAFLIFVPILVVWGPYQVLKIAGEEQQRLQKEQANEIERLRRNQNDLIHEMGELRSNQSDIASGVLPKHGAKVAETLRAKNEHLKSEKADADEAHATAKADHKSPKPDENADQKAQNNASKNHEDDHNSVNNKTAMASSALAGAAAGKVIGLEADEIDDHAAFAHPEIAPENELESVADEAVISDKTPVEIPVEIDEGYDDGLDVESDDPDDDEAQSETPFVKDDLGEQSDLANMAIALNFGDVKQKGDWEKAFETVSYDPNSLEFLRMTEDVLEVFEGQNIFVENLPLRLANGEIWYRFARGERGEEMTELAGVQDPQIMGRLLSYMQDNPDFKSLSVKFQKNFIRMLERYADDASDDDFEMINDSRGGRLFIILADISGRFLE